MFLLEDNATHSGQAVKESIREDLSALEERGILFVSMR